MVVGSRTRWSSEEEAVQTPLRDLAHDLRGRSPVRIREGLKELILGTGQYGNAWSPEAAAFLKKQGCKVIAKPTPKAIKILQLTCKPKDGLFHVTADPPGSAGR